MALNLKTETAFTDEIPAVQPPLPPAQIAPHFPQLEILECLGRGGMGVVYKARQKTLNRLVALKLLAPERVRDVKFAERFAREAQALAALNHPNIVTIHDFGQAGGFYFLLMEFVDGANLRQLLRARKFTPEEALTIVPPLCDALQFAHDRGIIHRDIKPENLLLDKTGRVKVADFGIAKMLGTFNGGGNAGEPAAPEGTTQSAAGTPGYSAPEQKTDPQHVDSRADIYSLGVVFYEMLTGELPGNRIEPPSRKVHIDVRLDEVVLRALEEKPELRFQQVSAVKTGVETIVNAGIANLKPILKSPFAHFIEAVFGITFTSRLAIKAANFSALGFLGCLSFLAYLPVPGLKRCWGFAGLYGCFGLMGVALLIEAAAQRRAKQPSRRRPNTQSVLNIILAAALALAGWAANELGMFFNALFVFVLLMVPVRIGLILWRLFHGSLEHRLWREPLARELRGHRFQVVNGWIFWLLAGLTLELCIVPAQFTSEEYSMIRALAWGGILTLMLSGLLPGKQIRVASNLVFAAGSIFMATQMARIYWPVPMTKGVVLSAPFRGEWLVVNGGRSTLINVHYGLSNQRDALDIERLVNGQERTGDPQQLESYPSWDETLYAPADGKIVTVINDRDDNPIGPTDLQFLAGNHIVLEIGNGRYVMMAHLRKGSVLVAPGDLVQVGQPVAKCGNSGNTSHPHLHIQAQNRPDAFAAKVETYPVLFRDATRVRSRRSSSNAPFFVRRNDRIIRESTRPGA